MKALQHQKEQFDSYLSTQNYSRAPQSLYEPFRYILSLGGKRLRPILLLEANRLLGGQFNDAKDAALAIELFHNFSLIHDDIMDLASLRRGKPTIHKKFGENIAILSGDAMLVYAYQALMKSKHALQSIHIFNQTAIEVCEGQQFDMDFESRLDVTIAEYIKMIELKTAVLVGASLKIGAITAGADSYIQQELYDFGRELGISFQIMDDVLDTYATDEKFGKKIGGDIVQNKKTFLLIKCLELADTNATNELLNWINESKFDEQEKINDVKRIYNQYNIFNLAKNEAEKYYNSAMQHLLNIEQKGYDMTVFREFSSQLLNRSN